jgi:hypothetical protein
MRFFKIHFLAITVLMVATMLGFAPNAHAVPSYARQTGLPCATCHSTYPELTSFGRLFKLNGYVTTGLSQIQSPTGGGLKINEVPPLSAMFVTSLTQMSKSLTDPVNGDNTQNGSWEFPQQLSFFFAGEISDHMGTFSQITYQHSSDHFTIDNVDFRYANQGTLGGKNTIYGLTLNNNPTVEDPYQGTPAWGFPFISSEIAPGPIASTLIDGGLAQDVVGIGGYTMIDNHWYGNLTFYRSEHAGVSEPYGSSLGIPTIKGLAPYLRLAYQTNFGDNFLEVGAYGLWANIAPDTVGTADKYVDTAVDAQWERNLEGGNSIVVRGTYINEKATFNASQPLGLVDNSSDTLKTFKLNGEYHFGASGAATVGVFRTTGSTDMTRYPASGNPTLVGSGCGVANPDPVTGAVSACDPAPGLGSANGSPENTGWVLQGTYLPWQNVQLGIQYTAYSKFNGSSDNYDGLGRKASDNNTLYAYGWFMW